MTFVIVEVVTDPRAAADELTTRGSHAVASEVIERGRGTFVLDHRAGIPQLPAHSPDGAEWELNRVREQRGVAFGMRHFLRTDFDPTWVKQNGAARAALAKVWTPRERCAIPAVNAFKRAYYTNWGSEWDTPDPGGGRWETHHARNFRDGALALANALAWVCRGDADMAQLIELKVSAWLGWDGDEVRPGARMRDEVWVMFSLGRILRECGDGGVRDLSEAIERGYEGHN